MRGLRLIVIGVALFAAVAAGVIVQNTLKSQRAVASVELPPPPPPPPEIPKAEVLVVGRDMRMGETINPTDLRWQPWPKEDLSESFITREAEPNAKDEITRSVVRSGLLTGEPLTRSKVLTLNNSSIMSALLRKHMRAVSISISEATGAGGFILPGDYVDVVFTRETASDSGSANGASQNAYRADTLIESARVLAIDQMFDDSDTNQAIVGRTATLEVTPDQAELVALASQKGVITLTLRGLSELLGPDGKVIKNPRPVTVMDLRGGGKGGNRNTLNVVRFGVPVSVVTE